MKKIVGLSILLGSALSVLAHAVEVKDGYLYGDLSIAYNNELPSGLFAKSSNYLPGDTIRISNPFTGEEISVLNLGSLDEGSDSVLLLTTEAANKLGIDFKEPLYVRVSPRTNDFDEIASGSAMLTHNKNALAEESPSPEPVKTAEATPVQESVKQAPAEEAAKEPARTEVAAAPEVPPAEKQSAPEPEIAPVPKEEPVADLSPLTENPPVVKAEPAGQAPAAKEEAVAIPVVPEKKEEPVAEKESEPAEETAVRQPKKASPKTARLQKTEKVYEELVPQSPAPLVAAAPASPAKPVPEEEAVEEPVSAPVIAASPVKQKDVPADILEEPVALSPVPAKPEKEDGTPSDVQEIPAFLPPLVSDIPSKADEGIEEFVIAGDVIPEITEESARLASNGLKEVPSAMLPVEEYTVSRPESSPVAADAVYEYPQTLRIPQKEEKESDSVKETPVSFRGAEPVVSEEFASSIVSEPVSLAGAEPVVRDEPEDEALAEPAALRGAEPVVSEDPVAGVMPEPVSWAGAEPVVREEPVDEAVPELVSFKGAEPVVSDSHLAESAPDMAAVEEEPVVDEIPVISSVPVAQSASAPKSPTGELESSVPVSVPPLSAVETAYKGPSVRGEPADAKKAESPAKETKPAAAKTTPVKKETPAKGKDPASAKTAVAKTETPAKEDKKKSSQAKVPVRETKEPDEDSDLIYTQKDELMLVPGDGGHRTYSGESKPAPSAPKAETPVATETDDDSDIIVNKQDVFTLSPTDSVGPDGQAGDGQKVYTPQRPAPKKEEPKSSKPVDTGSKPVKQSPKAVEPAPKADPAVKPAESSPKTSPAGSSKPAVRERDLKAGNYVQFATCTTDAEADKIISKYKKYPVVKVLFDTREGYKLLVGPLGEDEKGAVLARFRAFGYSDAYLRKVK